MTRTAALALLLTLTACGGFDTGLNPPAEIRKEQGPLTVPPAGVFRGISGEPASPATPAGLRPGGDGPSAAARR